MKIDLPIFERGTLKYVGTLHGITWPRNSSYVRILRRPKPLRVDWTGRHELPPTVEIDHVELSATYDKEGRINGALVEPGASLDRLSAVQEKNTYLPDVLQYPYRHRRAQEIANHVFRTILKYLKNEDGDEYERCSRDLYDLFCASGAEIISDADRAEAGLLERNGMGITREEMAILEMRRINMLLQPLSVPPLTSYASPERK